MNFSRFYNNFEQQMLPHVGLGIHIFLIYLVSPLQFFFGDLTKFFNVLWNSCEFSHNYYLGIQL